MILPPQVRSFFPEKRDVKCPGCKRELTLRRDGAPREEAIVEKRTQIGQKVAASYEGKCTCAYDDVTYRAVVFICPNYVASDMDPEGFEFRYMRPCKTGDERKSLDEQLEWAEGVVRRAFNMADWEAMGAPSQGLKEGNYLPRRR